MDKIWAAWFMRSHYDQKWLYKNRLPAHNILSLAIHFLHSRSYFFCDLTTLFDVLHIAYNTNARHLKCKCTQSNNSDMSINIESFQALWSMIAISFLCAFEMNQLGRMKTLRRNKCTVRLTFKIQLRLLKCKTENKRPERSFVNDE